MNARRVAWLLAAIGLAACQAPTSQVTAQLSPVALITSTALPTTQPTATPSLMPPSETERQQVEDQFSFIPPVGYSVDIDGLSVFMDQGVDGVFFSVAIIGAGDDERDIHEVVERIFDRFEGVEFETGVPVEVGGQETTQTDFNGVLQPSIVSGSYVVVELSEESGLLIIGLGNVLPTKDSWQAYAGAEFAQLLTTIELLQEFR
jgi:hypothetical protein